MLDDETDNDFFDQNGMWKMDVRPMVWDINPESLLESKDFLRILRLCVEKLPEKLAHLFILREFNHLTIEEICELLDITPRNLWVMLHCARIRLQHLLGRHCSMKGERV